MKELINKFHEKIIEIITVAIISLFTTIYLLFEEQIVKIIPNNEQFFVRVLFASLIFTFILISLILIEKNKTKKKASFGIYWDKDLKPYCPVCQTLLTNYSEENGNGVFVCMNCERPVFIKHSSGLGMSYQDVKNTFRNKWED